MTTFFRRRLTLLLAPAALLLSCGVPTGLCGCPPARTHAVAYGAVRTGAGAPVADAAIRVVLYREQCGVGYGEEADPGIRPARTDASGAYEAHFYSVSGPRTACLRVTASRAEGPAPDSAVAQGAFVALRNEREDPLRVRIDLVFP